MISHFTFEEFRCKDGTRVPDDLRVSCLQLMEQLEAVRPPDGLEVVSGYRSPAYNAKKKGAKNSKHMLAEAADVRPIVRVKGVRIPWLLVPNKRARIEAFFQDVNLAVAEGRAIFGGIGRYPGKWIHLDIRRKPADNHIARWEGTGVGSEIA